MRKHRLNSYILRPVDSNRNKLSKVYCEGEGSHADEHFKRKVIFRNKCNRYFKTPMRKICPIKMALAYKRQKRIVKGMALGMSMPRESSSNFDPIKWKVEEILFDERSTNSVKPLDFAAVGDCDFNEKRIPKSEYSPSVSEELSRELKTKNSSLHLSVGDKTYEEESFEFTSDSENETFGGHLEQSVGNSSGFTEFHHLSGKSYLLILRYPNRLHFRGTLSVTAVVGSTSILGYEFSPGMKSRLVFSPKGTSPLYLQAVGYLHKRNFEKVPSLLGVGKSILNRMGLRDSAILIEPASGELWERLFGTFASELNFNPLIPSAREKNHAHSELNVETNLGVKFVQPGESDVSSRLHDENSEWNQLSETVLNAFVDKGPIRTMVFGGKGVGKSTFMRFMINQWFSNCEKSVLFVDFDPGQPEFMPPGCISATIVSEPLLGPNYTHLKDPERMICIGDLNVERCPDWYLKCADELLKFCYSKPALCQIPWFINTMGFCRGIGGDLAVKLIQLCHPTHVIQIKSRFSRRNFEPVDLLSWQSANSWQGMDWNPSISNQKGPQLPEYFYYQLWSLAERSGVEENIQNFSQGAIETAARAAASFQDSGEMEDIDSEWGLPAWQSRDLCTVAYFSQMMSGSQHSVLQLRPHKIKLSDLILSLPSQLLEPQMTTSAFNARLVVLCNFKKDKETVVTENHISEDDPCEIPEVSVSDRKKVPWERILKPNTTHHPKVLFHMPLAPCLGFGIVRAIDKNSDSLFLTTPVKEEVLLSVNCLATSPSMGSLPKEIYFEPLRLNPKKRESIPYTVICDKKSILSRTIPRVFQLPSKLLAGKKS